MGCGRARGVRRNTRDMFSKAFGQKGLPSMSTYLAPYKCRPLKKQEAQIAAIRGCLVSCSAQDEIAWLWLIFGFSLQVGDYVDIVVNGAIHKGMPYRCDSARCAAQSQLFLLWPWLVIAAVSVGVLGHVGGYRVVARSSRAVAHRYYHGRTGKVWNITKSALGVMVNKAVRGRIISKRLHVRVEHVKASRCTEEFKNRVKDNEKTKALAKKAGSTNPFLSSLDLVRPLLFCVASCLECKRLRDLRVRSGEISGYFGKATEGAQQKHIKILKRLPKDPKPGFIVRVKKDVEGKKLQPAVMCAVPYELLA
eukprot:61992-Rhodomonas_salina.1